MMKTALSFSLWRKQRSVEKTKELREVLGKWRHYKPV